MRALLRLSTMARCAISGHELQSRYACCCCAERRVCLRTHSLQRGAQALAASPARAVPPDTPASATSPATLSVQPQAQPVAPTAQAAAAASVPAAPAAPAAPAILLALAVPGLFRYNEGSKQYGRVGPGTPMGLVIVGQWAFAQRLRPALLTWQRRRRRRVVHGSHLRQRQGAPGGAARY